MTIPITTAGSHPRGWLRSAGAVLAGFFAVVVLSLVTDQVLHALQVYPPWGPADVHYSHTPRPELVPDRARAHRPALRLARRTPIPRDASRLNLKSKEDLHAKDHAVPMV
jgi:hypothetical protein